MVERERQGRGTRDIILKLYVLESKLHSDNLGLGMEVELVVAVVVKDGWGRAMKPPCRELPNYSDRLRWWHEAT